jgi:hypothetical protein
VGPEWVVCLETIRNQFRSKRVNSAYSLGLSELTSRLTGEKRLRVAENQRQQTGRLIGARMDRSQMVMGHSPILGEASL